MTRPAHLLPTPEASPPPACRPSGCDTFVTSLIQLKKDLFAELRAVVIVSFLLFSLLVRHSLSIGREEVESAYLLLPVAGLLLQAVARSQPEGRRVALCLWAVPLLGGLAGRLAVTGLPHLPTSPVCKADWEAVMGFPPAGVAALLLLICPVYLPGMASGQVAAVCLAAVGGGVLGMGAYLGWAPPAAMPLWTGSICLYTFISPVANVLLCPACRAYESVFPDLRNRPVGWWSDTPDGVAGLSTAQPATGRPLYYGLLAGFLVVLFLTNLFVVRLTELCGIQVTAALFTYPFTFLMTDLVTELYGHRYGQRVVWSGFLLSVGLWVQTSLLGWVGGAHGAPFLRFFTFMPGILLGSLVAYAAAQLLDIKLFSWLRRQTGGRHLWLRNNVATLVSQFADTFLFGLVAWVVVPFLQGSSIASADWATVVWNEWWGKVVLALLDTPVLYASLYLIRRCGLAGAARPVEDEI